MVYIKDCPLYLADFEETEEAPCENCPYSYLADDYEYRCGIEKEVYK